LFQANYLHKQTTLRADFLIHSLLDAEKDAFLKRRRLVYGFQQTLQQRADAKRVANAAMIETVKQRSQSRWTVQSQKQPTAVSYVVEWAGHCRLSCPQQLCEHCFKCACS